MSVPAFLYHGGRPGLRVGDVITPEMGGRPAHEGCLFCEARQQEAVGGQRSVIDSLPTHRDRVYATPNRLYAKYYASLWGRGDLYRVEPVGEAVRSGEDTIESWHAPGWWIVKIYERAVLLTWTERRRLLKQWTVADEAFAGAASVRKVAL